MTLAVRIEAEALHEGAALLLALRLVRRAERRTVGRHATAEAGGLVARTSLELHARWNASFASVTGGGVGRCAAVRDVEIHGRATRSERTERGARREQREDHLADHG